MGKFNKCPLSVCSQLLWRSNWMSWTFRGWVVVIGIENGERLNNEIEKSTTAIQHFSVAVIELLLLDMLRQSNNWYIYFAFDKHMSTWRSQSPHTKHRAKEKGKKTDESNRNSNRKRVWRYRYLVDWYLQLEAHTESNRIEFESLECNNVRFIFPIFFFCQRFFLAFWLMRCIRLSAVILLYQIINDIE